MSIYPTKEQKLQSAQEGVNMLNTLYAAKVKECAQLQSELKAKDELLRESREQLEILINSFMDLRVADGPKKFAILRSMDDKISDALMVLKKLREVKK